MQDSRYIIGIDLGTTNTALCYIDTEQHGNDVGEFAIPQISGIGECKHLSLLPSFCYLPAINEFPKKSLALPWIENSGNIVGQFARSHGASSPNRLISSAKSWLCHAGIDRTQRILPWGNQSDVEMVSPIDVTTFYLTHLREAWDYKMRKFNQGTLSADHAFENQQIILTIPASFDETARELTILAAERANYKEFSLIEEPLAAFYAWLSKNEDNWGKLIHPGERILVIDIGGGTTDFSFIELDNNQQLRRFAVGDHLLLGGDNIDMTIAKKFETHWNVTLSGGDWFKLCQICREAKETLMSSDLTETDITLVSRGSSVIESVKKGKLTKPDFIHILNDGFYPQTNANEAPHKSRSGIRKMGLPYVDNPAITEHLIAFLCNAKTIAHSDAIGNREDSIENQIGEGIGVPCENNPVSIHHKANSSIDSPKFYESKEKEKLLYPDKILFNGGSLYGEQTRKRLISIISLWFPNRPPPVELEAEEFSLAVAKGAAYYGRGRRGNGVKVKSGITKAFYIEVAEKKDQKKLICIMPRKTGENIEVSVPGKFLVRANSKVLFNLYSSSVRLLDQCGNSVSSTDELTLVSPLVTVLQYGNLQEKNLEISISCIITEVGTLKVYLNSLTTDHKWPLDYDLRASLETVDNCKDPKKPTIVIESKKISMAIGILQETFNNDSARLSKIASLLENSLNLKKRDWSISLLRKFSDILLSLANSRERSAEHETRWLNLLGFCLRPGFSDVEDSLRIKKLWKIWFGGLIHCKDVQASAEWWVMWRRIAPGLKSGQQITIINKLRSELFPKGIYRRKVPQGEQAKREMWRCLGSLELLSVEMKKQIGELLISRGTKLESYEIWVIARLGSRRLFRSPANLILSPASAEEWINQLRPLHIKIKHDKMVLFAVSRISTFTGERTLDLPPDLRLDVIQFLEGNACPDYWLTQVREQCPTSTEEIENLLADSLPLGLTLIGLE